MTGLSHSISCLDSVAHQQALLADVDIIVFFVELGSDGDDWREAFATDLLSYRAPGWFRLLD